MAIYPYSTIWAISQLIRYGNKKEFPFHKILLSNFNSEQLNVSGNRPPNNASNFVVRKVYRAIVFKLLTQESGSKAAVFKSIKPRFGFGRFTICAYRAITSATHTSLSSADTTSALIRIRLIHIRPAATFAPTHAVTLSTPTKTSSVANTHSPNTHPNLLLHLPSLRPLLHPCLLYIHRPYSIRAFDRGKMQENIPFRAI